MAPTINLAQATKEHVLAVNRDYVAQPRITYRYMSKLQNRLEGHFSEALLITITCGQSSIVIR